MGMVWVWFCLPLASQGSQDLSLWKYVEMQWLQLSSVHHVSEFCHHLPSASKVAESGGSHSDSPQQRCPEENQLTWQNAARSAIIFSISKGCAS